MATSTRAASRAVPWNRAEPDRLVLILGPEELLADRAVDRLRRLIREEHPDVETVELDGSGGASLAEAASGSLFAPFTVVVIANAERMAEPLLSEALAYVAAPNPEAMVVFRHAGGKRVPKLIEALRKARAKEVNASAIKYDRDKEAFLNAELAAAGRQAELGAVRALVEAVGSDLRELASAASQIMADTTGRITAAMVDRYYGGRLEPTAYKVADAAVTGQTGEALRLARYALGAGAEPVLLIAVLASRLRQLALVGGAIQSGKDPAKELGMASWQVDQARRVLRSWDGPNLGRAILAAAQADAEVKGIGGGSQKSSRNYAVERAIIVTARAAGGQ
jgi:DNA polymerase-3 subunit delta